MKLARFWRTVGMLASGAVLIQAAGCNLSPIFEGLIVIFTGVTAGAALWIIKIAS